MTIEATTVVNFNTRDPSEPYLFNISLDDILNVETNESKLAKELEEETQFVSSPYLQMLTQHYYPRTGVVIEDTDENEETVVTTFPPESDVYLLANKSSNVSIDAVKVTDGSIISEGTVLRSGSAVNLFPGIEESTDTDGVRNDEFLLDIIPSTIDISYIGNEGRLEELISSIGVASFLHNVEYAPFLAKFEYDYSCNLYKLKSPTMTIVEGETYPIAVVFYITVSEA